MALDAVHVAPTEPTSGLPPRLAGAVEIAGPRLSPMRAAGTPGKSDEAYSPVFRGQKAILRSGLPRNVRHLLLTLTVLVDRHTLRTPWPFRIGGRKEASRDNRTLAYHTGMSRSAIERAIREAEGRLPSRGATKSNTTPVLRVERHGAGTHRTPSHYTLLLDSLEEFARAEEKRIEAERRPRRLKQRQEDAASSDSDGGGVASGERQGRRQGDASTPSSLSHRDTTTTRSGGLSEINGHSPEVQAVMQMWRVLYKERFPRGVDPPITSHDWRKAAELVGRVPDAEHRRKLLEGGMRTGTRWMRNEDCSWRLGAIVHALTVLEDLRTRGEL